MMRKTDMACFKCLYWQEREQHDDTHEPEGECRRYAPRMVMGVGTGYNEERFAVTLMTDWCGEYREVGG